MTWPETRPTDQEVLAWVEEVLAWVDGTTPSETDRPWRDDFTEVE